MSHIESPLIQLQDEPAFTLMLDPQVPVLINTLKPVAQTRAQFHAHVLTVIGTLERLKPQYPNLFFITDSRNFETIGGEDVQFITRQMDRLRATGVAGVVTIVPYQEKGMPFVESVTETIAAHGFWNVMAVNMEEAYGYLEGARSLHNPA